MWPFPFLSNIPSEKLDKHAHFGILGLMIGQSLDNLKLATPQFTECFYPKLNV